ncbi:MAG: NAD-dependent epimerase/dehydratase family protein [Bacteroidota bacterium]
MGKIIIIGAGGQIGTELTLKLRSIKGNDNVIAADVKEDCPFLLNDGPYLQLDILNAEEVKNQIIKNDVKEVYLLAALLSATAEKNPHFAWKLNMDGLFTILELAKDKIIDKIFWPSSIAVFGPTTPRINTPQYTVMEPSTVYGISKQAGERWCEYYATKFGVDVRSIRYPGLISYTSLPGGGTTDYAVDIFYQAKAGKNYTCFLSKETALPMMFMEDAIRATIELMEATKEKIKIRSSYNLSALSFTPSQLSEAIKQHLPEFSISYSPDFRQQIADSWPASIDDSNAREDWGWKEHYNLTEMVDVMLKNIDITLQK